MAVKRVKPDPGSKLTEKQVKMLREAGERPIVFDPDAPEQTEADLAEFRRVMDENKLERRKENVTLRLSQKTLKRARALGKGYTGFLSRLIDIAMDYPELVKKAL